jgi:hypothetical protein
MGLSAKLAILENLANLANSVNQHTGTFSEVSSPEFELTFVDLQRLDAALKSGRWNSKLLRRP